MLENKNIDYYLKKFIKLRRAPNKGGAPHKPILLLALMAQVEKGHIPDNRIFLTPELVAEFKSIWRTLVITKHDALIAQPFFHMRSEGFWSLVPNPGCELWIEKTKQLKSLSQVMAAINHAEIDKDLFLFLTEKKSREQLRNCLLTKYFNSRHLSYDDNSFAIYSNEMIKDKPEDYASRIDSLKKELDESGYEEEIFVRSGAFTKEILKLYNNTCCISELRVETLIDASIVDACHIVPFFSSHDDTVSNGIALTPTLHRAFDRGLVAISDNYRVIVSNKIHELGSSAYSIKQFTGKEIKCPASKIYWPGKVNIREHRTKFGFD